MPDTSGRHFLQIHGPIIALERVLRAVDNAAVDHRGLDFQKPGIAREHAVIRRHDMQRKVVRHVP